jgi:hypothetical protein
MRQRLREFCYEPEAKRGRQQRDVEVEGCFAGLLGWVLERWEGRRLALALDATSLKQDFVVLTLSVLFRSTAIPVAWCVVRGASPGRGRSTGRRCWPGWARGCRGIILCWCSRTGAVRPVAGRGDRGAGVASGDADQRGRAFHARGRGTAFKDHPITGVILDNPLLC